MELFENVKFFYGDVEDAFQRDYDDTDWRSVTLPHDWAVEFPFEQKNSSGTGFLPGGTGWYRIHFKVSDTMKDKIATLHFDGVYKHSKVWCNGYYLGQWANGYTAFSFPVTHTLHYGEEDNVIAVKVSHEDIADSRWYTGSGIQKTVYLQLQEAVHCVADEQIFSVKMKETSVAECVICDKIKNDTNVVQDVNYCITLVDKTGKIVSQCEKQLQIGAHKELESRAELTVDVPILWSDDNPYLYDLQTSVTFGKDDVKKDVITQKVGIRVFNFDADQGFFINGVNKKIKGVCLHEDAGCLGNAVPKEVWKRRLEKLKAMGANTIRMSHNPHSRELYDLCDEMGFYVIDEIFDEWEGAKNKWHNGHNVYPPKHQGYAEDYPEWHEKDVRSFVRANRNRPSVILWSIGNEIDYPNDPYCHPSFKTMTGNNDANKPAKEREYNPNHPNAERLSILAAELAELVRQEDTTRPVTLAAAFPELSADIGLFNAIDVIGYNYRERLYEKDHARFPDKPIMGSENGHSVDKWDAVTAHDYISGQCIWTGIDYLGESRGDWPIHGTNAGVLTTAGFEKANYGYRCALWKKEPVISLATGFDEADERYNNRELYWNYATGQIVKVNVFSNCDEVELFLNGRSLGKRELHYVTEYEVPFEAGELKAIGYNGAQQVVDQLVSNGVGVSLEVKAYDESVQADGKSVIQLELSMLDEKGNLVREDESMLKISVEGEATLLGLDNGNLADNTPFFERFRRLYRGKMMVYLRTTHNIGRYVVYMQHDRLGKIEYVGKLK